MYGIEIAGGITVIKLVLKMTVVAYSFNSSEKVTQLTLLQVFLVRKINGKDAGKMYAMKVLKKASLKGINWKDGNTNTMIQW